MKNKKCTKCGKTYPSTKEFFFENKISSSTLRDFLISVKDGSLRMELNN